MKSEAPSQYGILQQTAAADDVDYDVESLRHLGYAVVGGNYDKHWLDALTAAFERAYAKNAAAHGGRDVLAAIDEHNTIRLPLAFEPAFLELASNPGVLEICRRLIASYIILNQQNGVINPPRGALYNQGAWHRDLPYQHFTSSRPLAINALFCIDPFTIENGATKVLPASHLQESFPSDRFIGAEAISIEAPAGSFIMLDCMLFHCGGVNSTDLPRRAVNHVYSIPHIRQQIDLPSALGEKFTADAALRQLLGYEISTPHTVADYYAGRQKRKQK
jgi:hypothetical protein